MGRRLPLPPLVMSSKRSVWRMHDHADEADRAFRQVRTAILKEFDYTCPYCDHASEKYQEVHHSDDDHKNNAPQNLVCTCPLCHQVFHIGLAGMKDGADIVYVPELGQAEINQLALVIWLVTETDESRFKDQQDRLYFSRLAGRAKTIQGILENRRGTVLLKLKEALKETKFPQELVGKIKLSHLSPILLSNVLMSLDDKDYANRAELLGGLRLLPKPVRFRERIKYWSGEQDGILPVPSWARLLPEVAITELITSCTGRVALMAGSRQGG